MAFNGSFAISVSDNPATIILTDSSTGDDPNLTGRTIRLNRADGTLYSPAITWPIAQSSIELPILTEDAALNIMVTWASSDVLPSPSTYSASQIYAFLGYGYAFLYYLTQIITSHPSILQDKGYYYNKLVFLVEISSAQNCITVGQDLYGAQSCIDRYYRFIQNENYYF